MYAIGNFPFVKFCQFIWPKVHISFRVFCNFTCKLDQNWLQRTKELAKNKPVASNYPFYSPLYWDNLREMVDHMTSSSESFQLWFHYQDVLKLSPSISPLSSLSICIVFTKRSVFNKNSSKLTTSFLSSTLFWNIPGNAWRSKSGLWHASMKHLGNFHVEVYEYFISP